MEEEEEISICVTTASAEAFEVRARLDWSVGRLKQLVSLHLGLHSGQHLRLLHGGRMLPDEHVALADVLVQRVDGRASVHAAVSERRTADVALQISAAPASGFERLREAGLTEQEVEELRAEFASIHGGRVLREEEDRWLDGEAMARNGANNNNGNNGAASEWTHEALFGGLLMGFAFPPIIFLGSEFNKHGKAGLVIGCLLNVVSWTVYSFFI